MSNNREAELLARLRESGVDLRSNAERNPAAALFAVIVAETSAWAIWSDSEHFHCDELPLSAVEARNCLRLRPSQKHQKFPLRDASQCINWVATRWESNKALNGNIASLVSFVPFEGGSKEFWECYDVKSGKSHIARSTSEVDCETGGHILGDDRMSGWDEVLNELVPATRHIFSLSMGDDVWLQPTLSRLFMRSLITELAQRVKGTSI